ncbi:hypothetical protein MCC01979_14050 [Bifidobacteriaceae bacterium MCC01979]|nr:hypothetical protein MCC01983_15380 [Bifidobacteriaceae bacterium MCC01983]GDZ54555.1 hypothetical protein MCC01979_14050 [Bifidobacteriaceae bacterium MCC01979]
MIYRHGNAANINGVSEQIAMSFVRPANKQWNKTNIETGKTIAHSMAITAFSAIPMLAPVMEITRATSECQPTG